MPPLRVSRLASRAVTRPASSARRASSARLRFCGRSATSSLRKRARTCVLTPSSETASLLGDLPVARRGRNSRGPQQRSAERHEHPALGLGQPRQRSSVAGRGALAELDRGAKRQQCIATPNRVSVAEVPSPQQSLAIHEGAVPRQPVVDHGPAARHTLQHRMRPGDLGIPPHRDVVLIDPPEPDSLLIAQAGQTQAALAVAVHEKRRCFTLHREHRGELGRSERVPCECHVPHCRREG